jgi:amino acid transporter
VTQETPSSTPPPTDESSPTTDIARRDSQQLRRSTVGVLGIAFLVISAAAPLTAMAGGAPVAMLLGNGPGIPAAYVVVSVILLIFSVGYTAMARHHTSTGAFYSFVSRGLKQPAGGAAAIIALLGYNAMQIGLYGLFGAAASGFFGDVLGINVPWWVCVFVAMAIIAVLGYRQVDLSVKVLAILVSLEFLIVLILDATILIKGGEGGTAPLTATPFTWASFTTGSVAIALLFNFASFIGFEATTIYSEEAKDPKRTVPRATYAAVLTIGAFYTLTTYLMVEGQGAAGLQEYLATLQPDPTAFLFALGATYFGATLTTVMSLLFISSVFAALLAFHNAVARYLYALGREGLVPAQLGHTHPKHLSPHTGSLSQSILALVVVLIFVITAQDPVLALFTWLTQLGTLAIIVLMALASFAVVAFFARHRDLDSNVLRTTVAPIVGGLAMTAVAIYAASQFGLLIGNPESPLRWILPALIVVAAIAGIIAAVSLRTRSPELYAQMGRHRDIELMPG